MKESKLRVGLYINDPKANVLKFVRCLREWNMSFASIEATEHKFDTEVLREPPVKAAGLLKNILHWSAGR